MDPEIRHDVESERFVVEFEASEGELVYHREDDVADFRSTFVPPDHRKRGIGEKLVLAGLRWARDEGLRVKPTCPFVGDVLAEHPEFAGLVDEEDG